MINVTNDKNRCSIFTDTGGTFSDAIIVHEDVTFTSGKSFTTPANLEEWFIRAI